VCDHLGNIFVADQANHVIRKINIKGEVCTIAGTPGKSGHIDGPALIAKFNDPMSISLDRLGNLYVADFSNHIIRKVTKVTEPDPGSDILNKISIDFSNLAKQHNRVGPSSTIYIHSQCVSVAKQIISARCAVLNTNLSFFESID